MSRQVRRALIGAATVVAAMACVELNGPKTGVVSISSLRIPYPSVVLGDVMRDSLGAPAPLSMIAYGPSGAALATEPITFLSLDSTIAIDADGTVHGLLRDTLGGRALAGAGGLQTAPQRIIVTIAPTTATKAAVATSIVFDPLTPDSTVQANRSPSLELTLAGAAAAPAQGYVVSYQVIRSPAPFVAGVPTAYVADDAARKSLRDTTDSKGLASRRVVLRVANFGGTNPDTIIVRATVKYLGAQVSGSPVDFIVPVSKKP